MNRADIEDIRQLIFPLDLYQFGGQSKTRLLSTDEKGFDVDSQNLSDTSSRDAEVYNVGDVDTDYLAVLYSCSHVVMRDIQVPK